MNSAKTPTAGKRVHCIFSRRYLIGCSSSLTQNLVTETNPSSRSSRFLERIDDRDRRSTCVEQGASLDLYSYLREWIKDWSISPLYSIHIYLKIWAICTLYPTVCFRRGRCSRNERWRQRSRPGEMRSIGRIYIMYLSIIAIRLFTAKTVALYLGYR